MRKSNNEFSFTNDEKDIGNTKFQYNKIESSSVGKGLFDNRGLPVKTVDVYKAQVKKFKRPQSSSGALNRIIASDTKFQSRPLPIHHSEPGKRLLFF